MERNPYLILGVPFGSSREEANVAFARRTRALRRQGDAGREGLIELTWALNQVDEAIADPLAALDVYRIPADSRAFESEAPGMFAPAPEVLSRRQPPSEQALRDLLNGAARELLLAVLLAEGRATKLPEY